MNEKFYIIMRRNGRERFVSEINDMEDFGSCVDYADGPSHAPFFSSELLAESKVKELEVYCEKLDDEGGCFFYGNAEFRVESESRIKEMQLSAELDQQRERGRLGYYDYLQIDGNTIYLGNEVDPNLDEESEEAAVAAVYIIGGVLHVEIRTEEGYYAPAWISNSFKIVYTYMAEKLRSGVGRSPE